VRENSAERLDGAVVEEGREPGCELVLNLFGREGSSEERGCDGSQEWCKGSCCCERCRMIQGCFRPDWEVETGVGRPQC